ncbi:MAG: hypothetical protein M1834_000454 [Cirrosporium novae-zelandiae]|nr:MAG: hypothetical protein M1834_000454 [Cirrosporium novae-zelandiae]
MIIHVSFHFDSVNLSILAQTVSVNKSFYASSTDLIHTNALLEPNSFATDLSLTKQRVELDFGPHPVRLFDEFFNALKIPHSVE